MGKGKRNKSRLNQNNKEKVKTVKKLSKKEQFLNLIKEYKFIIILALLFSVYVAFFPKDYTTEVRTAEEQIEVLTSKLNELEANTSENVQAINKEIEELTIERDELKEVLDNLKSN